MNGLSLPELLIAAGIASILVLIIGSAYSSHIKIVSNQNTVIDISTQNQIGLNEIINEIRESSSVVDSCCTSPGPEQVTGTNKIVLQIWPLNTTSGEPQEPPASPASTDYDYIVYERDSEKQALTKKIIPCSGTCTSKRGSLNKLIAARVASLSFEYSPNSPSSSAAEEVTVTVTTTKTDIGKDFSNTQSAKATIRNK